LARARTLISSSIPRFFLTALALVGCVYVLLLVAAWAGQRAMMYPAPKQAEEPRLVGAELLRIPGPEGRIVYALYARAAGSAPTLVHFHGNGEALAHVAWLVEELREHGLGVLAVEYPGYGLAHDYPTTKDAILADATAGVAHLHGALGVPVERTILMGQSLGTGVAAELARRGLGHKLILISPYTSTRELAQRIAPILPMRWVLRDNFEILGIAPAIVVPTMVIHGKKDALIPLSMARRVTEKLPHAHLLVIDPADHNDILLVEERHALREIAAFTSR
jgi:hypothetical protein